MIVVKVGGGKDIDVDAVVDNLVGLSETGQPLVLVHGGGRDPQRSGRGAGAPTAVHHQRERLQ